jgi:protein-disulfide isomerase
MHRLFVLFLVVAGCAARPRSSTTPSSPELETRLSKLEADNAKYAEALEFLQRVYEQQKASEKAADEQRPAPDAIFAVPVADAVAAGQVSGPPTAAVTIIKAYDFACPYCAQLNTTLDELVAEYQGKIRVVYENMVVHPFAMTAHLAGCAAGKQGKYLAFKKVIWDKAFAQYAAARDPEKLAEANLLALAGEAGLDAARLKSDMTSSACKARIEADMQVLETFGVSGTPTLFINGTMLPSGVSKGELKQLIDGKLSAVAASGVAGADYYAKEVMGKGETRFRSKNEPKP